MNWNKYLLGHLISRFRRKGTSRTVNSDLLRSVADIGLPDLRSCCYSTFDYEKKEWRPIDISDHYKAIAQYNLNRSVPRDIAIQFETAKNLYLYAWYIYRFHPVAEHHALACLELALRERYSKEIPKEKPTLHHLLRYAIDRGDIKNEGFREWHAAVKNRAEYRYSVEKSKEMQEKGLDQIELHYEEVKITDIDRNLDYVKIIWETLPKTRNLYAHGTTMLHNTVLGTFEIVSEIVNQIYPED